MQSQTLSGTLHIEKATRPSFGVVVLDWMIYFLMIRFLVMFPPNLFIVFLRYLVFFIALSTTFSFLFTPRYYSVFEAAKDPTKESQKTTSDSSSKQETKPTSLDSSESGKTTQREESSSDTVNIPQFCAECGSKIEFSGRFCTACGTSIRT